MINSRKLCVGTLEVPLFEVRAAGCARTLIINGWTEGIDGQWQKSKVCIYLVGLSPAMVLCKLQEVA